MSGSLPIDWDDIVAAANAGTRDAGQWRSLRTLSGPGPLVTFEGRDVVSFSSNDYLGLASHPTLIAAAQQAAAEFGTGSGASRLVVGGRPIHDRLEAALAAWKGAEAAVTFPSGFAANLGAIGALVAAAGRDRTVVFSDELNHASIIDGARLSRARVEVYRHVDLDDLAQRLAEHAGQRCLVASDAVFSMDGDVAPVAELAELCAHHGALLVLDEAHAVLGPDTPRPGRTVVVGTMSKALGSVGGFVAAPRPIVDLIVNRARSLIFTTAPSPVDAAAALAAVGLVRGDEGRRLTERLRANVALFRPGHPSPIVPVVVGDERRAVGISNALLEAGYLVAAIRPPTVAPGTSRLRVAISAAHERADVIELRERITELTGVPHG